MTLIWRLIPPHHPSYVQAFGFNGSRFSTNRTGAHEGDNERYNAAHLFDQLAEGKRSARADARRENRGKDGVPAGE